jgi:hypothetical protein
MTGESLRLWAGTLSAPIGGAAGVATVRSLRALRCAAKRFALTLVDERLRVPIRICSGRLRRL